MSEHQNRPPRPGRSGHGLRRLRCAGALLLRTAAVGDSFDVWGSTSHFNGSDRGRIQAIGGSGRCSPRDAGDETPVLILSARGEEVDKIQGFKLGADDYVVKPVGLVELLFRVQAILRRINKWRAPANGERHRLGDVEVDLGARTVTRGGRLLDVTPLEFELLACLIRHRGNPVDRGTILAEVWGFPEPGRVKTRTIDTHVATLRAKIEADPSEPELLLTVRKIGYRLSE